MKTSHKVNHRSFCGWYCSREDVEHKHGRAKHAMFPYEADGGNFEQNHWLTLWLILTIFLNLVIWNFLLSLVMNCVLSWCTPYCEWFLGFRKKSGWNWGNDRCTKLFRVKKNTLILVQLLIVRNDFEISVLTTLNYPYLPCI